MDSKGQAPGTWASVRVRPGSQKLQWETEEEEAWTGTAGAGGEGAASGCEVLRSRPEKGEVPVGSEVRQQAAARGVGANTAVEREGPGAGQSRAEHSHRGY